MSDYGLKISLPGYDVRTATPEQCAVHSSYASFKSKTNQTPPHFATVNVDFTASVTQAVTHTLYAIDHDYGYIPFNMPNITFDDGAGSIVTGLSYAGVGATLIIEATCTATQFLITIYDDFFWTSNNATLSVSYYIFAENGT